MKLFHPPPLHSWWPLVKSAGASWLDDYAPSMGAALSYYTVFSLAPLLLIVISIAGLVFGQDAARGEIFGQLRVMMGADAAKAVEGLLVSVSKPSQGIAATAIGVAVLLIGATSVFGELQDALDRIWRAPARNKPSGLWGLLRTRLLSFGMILGIAFLLMVSLVLGAVISALGKWWGDYFGGWTVLAQVVNVVIGFVLTTGVFAMIYKLMPRVTVRWHDVALGALVTALLFTVGKFLIGLYIGKSGVASGYGAAGSLVIVFLWVYYSAQVFLMGAEFTWVYARTFGSMKHVVPSTDETAADGIPSRSGDAPSDDRPGAMASPETTTVSPASPASPASAASAAPARPATPIMARAAGTAAPARSARRPVWKDVGAGVAFTLALRYVVPRLLRRL